MIFHHSFLFFFCSNSFGFALFSNFIVSHPDCPLSTILVSVADSTLLRMHFVNRQAVPADDCQTPHTSELRLFILCKNGAMITATAGRGMEPSATLLSER